MLHVADHTIGTTPAGLSTELVGGEPHITSQLKGTVHFMPPGVQLSAGKAVCFFEQLCFACRAGHDWAIALAS